MVRKPSRSSPPEWQLITDSKELAGFCARQAGADFVTVDTEFMRDKTFWPLLCLVQIGGPDEAAAVDTLADGIDLKPLFELLSAPKVTKVFHAARQDIEIFYLLAGIIPKPLFDTQVAAMVCGFGESAAYATLVAKLAGARVDKTSRFTDWARRPLSDTQLRYAIADVTHMRPVYERLHKRLADSGRAAWLEEEMALLTDPATYRIDPRTAWNRLKTKSGNRRFLAVLRELAAWREEEAMRRNLPRNRILRDDALMDIAGHAPENAAQLSRCRGIPRGYADSAGGKGILAAVARGRAIPDAKCPEVPAKPVRPPGIAPVTELLRVLLKHKCEAHHVAQKLVASADDLAAIAADDGADVPALHGWRRDLFGGDALALKQGRLALCVRGREIALIEAPPREMTRTAKPATASRGHARK